tara:strand:+ start:105 stop:686 length:582 start_codon:yes stop_codon:yes gene_type:complete
MKKTFTILTIVVLSTTISFAQQGTVALGVGSNLANQSWQDYSLVPTVGYFMTDNIMVGTGFSMFSSNDEVNSVEYKLNDMSISPFARFYLNESMYVSAGVNMTSSSDVEEAPGSLDYKDTYKVSTFGFNGGIGYSLMWNDHICIEPSLGFRTSSGTSTSKYESGGNTNSTSTDTPTTFGIGIGLGINIRLGVE